MGKKFLFESILNKESDQESEYSDDLANGDASDADSEDAELQRAFAKGELKPGLHGLVAFKRTESSVNDKNGLKRKLEEIQIFKDNWLERLDLISEPAKITPDLKKRYGDLELKLDKKGEISGADTLDRAQHDFKQEMLFYLQAQTTVINSMNLLHTKYGIKQTSRPSDYFAEMVKSDDHMKKVRERLQSKQNSIEASEKAKKLRELKKYGKKVQQEVQLKRQKEKKMLLQKIQKYKKGQEESLDFLEDEQTKSTNKAHSKQNQATQKKKVTKKQSYKDTKYGYGGQKKRSKYNSGDSAANISGFSVKKHGRPKVNKKQNRPGKSRRQNAKQRKS